MHLKLRVYCSTHHSVLKAFDNDSWGQVGTEQSDFLSDKLHDALGVTGLEVAAVELVTAGSRVKHRKF